MASTAFPPTQQSQPLETVSHEQQLFDRQVRLWGSHGQRQLRHTNILALGSSVTITEALKGIILPSVQSYTIVDESMVREFNISNNFFLLESDLGKPLAECLVNALHDLNTSCEPIAILENISDFIIRLCFNTLYQQHHPQQNMDGKYTPLSTYSLLGDNTSHQNKIDTNPQLSSQLDLYLQTAYPLSHTLFTNINSTTTTTLHNYSMILIDPTRVPLPVQNLLAIFISHFNIPLFTIGSYSTLSFIKTTYSQRCVIETHNKINPATKNLNLSPYQLAQFRPLIDYATTAEYDFLDLPPITPPTINDGPDANSYWLNMLGLRSKVPFPLILARMAYNYAKKHDKSIEDLNSKDLVAFKQYVKGFQWKNEESFDEALAHSRFMTTPVNISPFLLNILNNSLIVSPSSTSILIKGVEKKEHIPITFPCVSGYGEFFTIFPLLQQIYDYFYILDLGSPKHLRNDSNNSTDLVGSKDEKCEQMIEHNGQKQPTQSIISTQMLPETLGDENHPFWLLVIALRLFVLSFPLSTVISQLSRTNIVSFQSYCPDLPLISIFDEISLQSSLSSHNSPQFQQHTPTPTPTPAPIPALTAFPPSTVLHTIQGCLPIYPVLPDMNASTASYQMLKKTYQKQFVIHQVHFIFYLMYVLQIYFTHRTLLITMLLHHNDWDMNDFQQKHTQLLTNFQKQNQNEHTEQTEQTEQNVQNVLHMNDTEISPLQSLPSTSHDKFSNITLFFLHLKQTLHVEQPFSHFLLHCRELRINSAPTTLSFLNVDETHQLFSKNEHFQVKKVHNDNLHDQKSLNSIPLAPQHSMRDENSSPSPTLPSSHCIREQIPVFIDSKNSKNSKEDPLDLFFSPKNLWDCLTIPFLTTYHQLHTSFTNSYPPHILQTLFNTPTHQRRQKAVQSFLQEFTYAESTPYLIHYYCTIISLYEFQYQLHRFPSSKTTKSKTRISACLSLFSISPQCSTILMVNPMDIPFSSIPHHINTPHLITTSQNNASISSISSTNSTNSTGSDTLPLANAVANSYTDLKPLEKFHTIIFHQLLSTASHLASPLNLSASPNQLLFQDQYNQNNQNDIQLQSQNMDDEASSPLLSFSTMKKTTPVVIYDLHGEELTSLQILTPLLETTQQCFAHQFTELPTTASITGAMCSDLLLKMALNQYSMVETTLLFDSAHQRGANLFL